MSSVERVVAWHMLVRAGLACLLLLVPVALAGPVTNGVSSEVCRPHLGVQLYPCVEEHDRPGCRTSWVGLFGPVFVVSVFAADGCPSGRSIVYVWLTAGVIASFRWTANEHGCTMDLRQQMIFEGDLGCPAGPPPNPGWGRLLP